MEEEEEGNMGTAYECDTEEQYSYWRKEYWRQVRESEGFDIESVSGPVGITGLLRYDCQHKRYPDRSMIKQYATLGLHRYNMLEGTSFELSHLIKFNMLQNLVSSYYITLVAYDPEVSLSRKTFQVRVDEKKYRSLDVVVSVARLKKDQDEVATTKKPFMPHFYGDAMATPFFEGDLPHWPSYDALNDKNRFYVLKKSEWLDSAWIPLYLETLVYANDRNISDRNLSKLEIINVAIETEEEDVKPPNQRLKAKSAHVYITFKGLAESFFLEKPFKYAVDAQRVGGELERKAIIRRVISGGAFNLVGKILRGQNVEQRSMILRSGRKGTSSSSSSSSLG